MILSCCENSQSRNKTGSVSFDIDSIRARGTLRAVTDFNSTNYFLYKGEPMGFNYELLKSFSDHIGVDLEIVTEDNIQESFDILRTGNADMLALGFTVASSAGEEIQFTEPVNETGQVLVQRKPDNRNLPAPDDVEEKMIRAREQLANKTIYTQMGSSNVEQLNLLSKEIISPINIIQVPYDSENLIQLVENGEIDYAVCDQNVAMVNATYYPDIDINTTLSFSQDLVWGIRKTGSDELLKEFNVWISNFRKTNTYALLYAKYFRNTRSNSIINSDYYALNTGKVSPWDDLIKIYSDSIRWDWRLLASLIYQESRFIPDVRSLAGAYGLMQIMPETGRNFGIDITSSPGNNLKAGTKYINWLHSIFDEKIQDENERMRFILAAYNAGPAHVLDAMRLAEKNGNDPHVWENNVSVWLQKKADPKYFNDEVVNSGYYPGHSSVLFVDQILDRYEHYKNIVP